MSRGQQMKLGCEIFGCGEATFGELYQAALERGFVACESKTTDPETGRSQVRYVVGKPAKPVCHRTGENNSPSNIRGVKLLISPEHFGIKSNFVGYSGSFAGENERPGALFSIDPDKFRGHKLYRVNAVHITDSEPRLPGHLRAFDGGKLEALDPDEGKFRIGEYNFHLRKGWELQSRVGSLVSKGDIVAKETVGHALASGGVHEYRFYLSQMVWEGPEESWYETGYSGVVKNNGYSEE